MCLSLIPLLNSSKGCVTFCLCNCISPTWILLQYRSGRIAFVIPCPAAFALGGCIQEQLLSWKLLRYEWSVLRILLIWWWVLGFLIFFLKLQLLESLGGTRISVFMFLSKWLTPVAENTSRVYPRGWEARWWIKKMQQFWVLISWLFKPIS